MRGGRNKQDFINKELQFGLEKEKQFKKIINSSKYKFKSNFKKTENIYESYDFYNNNKIIELKARRIKKNSFKDTVITHKKILNLTKRQREEKKKVYLFFMFVDGIYYISLNKAIKKGTIKPFKRREYIYYTPHLFILIKDLKQLEENKVENFKRIAKKGRKKQ